MPHELIITLVYKITLCRWLCQILYVKFYSFTVLVLMVVGLVLVLEIYFWSRSCSCQILVLLTFLHMPMFQWNNFLLDFSKTLRFLNGHNFFCPRWIKQTYDILFQTVYWFFRQIFSFVVFFSGLNPKLTGLWCSIDFWTVSNQETLSVLLKIQMFVIYILARRSVHCQKRRR